MKRVLSTIFAAGALALFAAAPATAGTIDDTSLVSPGVYFGTGNAGTNIHWTVDTDNGIETGLTAIQRGVGATITPTGNVYNVPLGPDPTNPARAYWNLDFSINLRALGLNSNTLTLGQVVSSLSMTDVGTGVTSTINPVMTYPDNSAYAANGTTRNGNVSGQQATPADIGLQNSENPVFFPLLANYLMNDTYDFTLTVSDVHGNVLSSDSIVVVAGTGASPVPGPIVGAGLPGLVMACGGFLALARRRRKQHSATVS